MVMTFIYDNLISKRRASLKYLKIKTFRKLLATYMVVVDENNEVMLPY